jgi:hypothetical protein
MTDLTNKIQSIPLVELQNLYNKYSQVLENIKPESQLPYMAIIIDVAIKYINENHATIPKDWKAWTVLVLKHKYFQNKINSETDITKSIDEFIKYYNENYIEYISRMISVTEFDRDYGFVVEYLNT